MDGTILSTLEGMPDGATALGRPAKLQLEGRVVAALGRCLARHGLADTDIEGRLAFLEAKAAPTNRELDSTNIFVRYHLNNL